MATDKQIQANRTNSKSSTGPRTAAGLEKVSRNRTWHGLTGRFEVMKGESQDTFDNLFQQFVADQKPVGPVETELVRKMAEYNWLRQRASRFHESCFLVSEQTPEQIATGQADIRINPELEKFIRYQAQYDRLFQRALSDLMKLRKERRLDEIGFESRERAERVVVIREKRQSQRDELHPYLVMKAKMSVERQMERIPSRQNAVAPPETGQMAA
jgi:hypothetical protein